MDASSPSPASDPKYLMSQLNTARKEINNLRQQVKSLKYILDKDVDGIKNAIKSYVNGKPNSTENCILSSGAQQPGPSSQEDDTLRLKPIGVINTGFPSKRATPRQAGIVKTAPGKVTLFNSIFTNPEHALTGLQDFSHMWILFHFHRNDSTHIRAKVAPPRLNGVRTGVFSTRSPHRPCPIGLSLVKIVRIENNIIFFEGVDMVDETPVLDIKPYIPQYDNPLHIEKMIGRPNDVSNASENHQNHNRDESPGESAVNRLNAISVELDLSEESHTGLARENNDIGNGEEASLLPNVSRDEEIAMRLQAEEFEASPSSFDDYGSRNFFLPENPIEDHFEDSYNSSNDAIRDTVISASPNIEQSFGSMILEPRGNSQTANSSQQQIGDSSRNDENLGNIRTPRNSRLLDGADGSSTVCASDVDLIRRRALNARPDNSPIRMGVREAPDGEEGLESQPLTPSQTMSNIHSVDPAVTANVTEPSVENTRSVANFRAESGNFEVRVPDWISRPRTQQLSVVFNERALSQLNEILDDKADEQKRAIENVLREDPRSVYLRQRWGNQFYTFLIHDLHISCRFDDNRGVVTVFQVRHAGRTCECGEPEWQCLGHSPLS